jgi:hypothetical protein
LTGGWQWLRAQPRESAPPSPAFAHEGARIAALDLDARGSPFDNTLTRILRMESVQQGAAVQLTIPDVGVFRIPIVRRPLPRRGGQGILYRCPGCFKPRRHLYLRSLVIGRLVD